MINYPELTLRTNQIQPSVSQYNADVLDELGRAMNALTSPACGEDELPALVDTYVHRVRSARLSLVAAPTSEGLGNQFTAPDELVPAVVMGVDGSQLLPRPHSDERWVALNAACVAYAAGCDLSGAKMTRVTTQPLLPPDGQQIGGWSRLLESIPVQRDLLEKQWLAHHAMAEQAAGNQVVGLMDGGIELWGGRMQTIGAMDHMVQQCDAVYRQLTEAGVIYGGFIGSAQSTMLTHLLEVATVGKTGLSSLNQGRLYPTLTDGDILARWLRPRHRSPVFRVTGRGSSLGDGAMALHVLYINLGTEETPYITRAEIPRWVAEDPGKVSLFHRHLLHQADLLRLPFPAVLALADRACHITSSERRAIELLFGSHSATHSQGVRPASSAKMKMKQILRKNRGGR